MIVQFLFVVPLRSGTILLSNLKDVVQEFGYDPGEAKPIPALGLIRPVKNVGYLPKIKN